MKYIVTGKQMRAADAHTIEQIGIPSMVLMERAALSVLNVLEHEDVDFSNTLVVCGMGNNGGDGYAIARLLHLKGYKVTICFVGEEEKRSEENRAQKSIAEFYNILEINEVFSQKYTLIIDAIFGTGLRRNVEADYYDVIENINKMSGYKVSVDIPSGLNDETGMPMGNAVIADMTVALAYTKLGHVIQASNPYVGYLVVADIGITNHSLENQEKLIYTYEFEDFKNYFPKRFENSHKGNFGKVLLVVGSKGMAGAASLCAKAAYMVGAGLVRVYTHEENREILQKSLPEAIVSTYNKYDEKELTELLEWANVVGIGCGLGTCDTAKFITEHVMRNVKVPCVVDADALNLIAYNLQLLENSDCPIILTPHMKEMSRLLNCEVAELLSNKLEKLLCFSKEENITCVLKDARTFVCNKDKDVYLNLTGNSAMAKGGSGDVLTGMIAGILAQKCEAYQSACLGVYLHGLAGDYAAEHKGKYSVLASDLIDYIGDVLKQVERQ